MQGTIVQINISRGGLPKTAIAAADITRLGLDGDHHAHPQIHGGPLKAVLLIASEVVEALIARGYPLFYGAMGENLTTRGIDVREVRLGDRFQAGGAVLEITQPRGPCAALDVYGATLQIDVYDAAVKRRDPSSPHWGMSGFYASVVTPGAVREGDTISRVSEIA